MKYLTNSGLSYFFNKIKAYIASQLNSKASAIHTHTYSEIVDLPNGIAVDSTLDGTSSNAISNSAVSNALDGKISSEIDSMGEGWVRFKSGLQICWGVSNDIQCNSRGTVFFSISYKSFNSNPSLLLTRLGGITGWAQLQCSVINLTTTYITVSIYNNGSENVSSQSGFFWQAIGYWK